MEGHRKWRNLLDKFHVYGGLFSVGFLTVFSISAFYHQHHPKFPKPGEKTSDWEASLSMPEISDHHAFKLAVRDSLGLFGQAPGPYSSHCTRLPPGCGGTGRDPSS